MLCSEIVLGQLPEQCLSSRTPQNWAQLIKSSSPADVALLWGHGSTQVMFNLSQRASVFPTACLPPSSLEIKSGDCKCCVGCPLRYLNSLHLA